MPECPTTYREPARDLPVLGEWDVVVCGGGPAGVGAALAAARNGARVALLENEACLGGAGTAGMLNRLGPYHDQREIIVGGIAWEILATLRQRGLAGPPTICPPKDWQNYWLVFDPEGMKLLLDELLLAAGVTLLLGARVADVIMDGARIRGVLIESKSKRQAVFGTVVVDATGDGDVAAWAGAPFAMGRPGDGLVQPVTLMSKALNQDWPRSFEYYRAHAAELQMKAKADGSDVVWPGTDNWLRPEETYYNCLHVHRVDATDVRDLTRALIAMRRLIWQNLAVLRRHVPGCERASLITTAARLGIRESRRITGDYELTIGDVLDARQFDDQVYRYACFVDIHQVDSQGRHSEYANRELASGQSYGVPYRCLLPRGVEQLLVAGRCFSATHEALASARMIPSCLAMGQAAGTAAALCVQSSAAPRALAPARLRAALAAQGVNL